MAENDFVRFSLDISRNGAINIIIVSVDVTSSPAGAAMYYPVEREPSDGPRNFFSVKVFRLDLEASFKRLLFC